METKLAITSASDDQLRAFAAETLQIEPPQGANRSQLLAAIGPAWPNDYIFVTVEAGDANAGAPAIANARETFRTGRDDGPMVMLKIGETTLPGGEFPATPSVNGKMLVIQRNMLVAVPYAYYEALSHAIVGDLQDAGNLETGAISRRQITNYPLSEVRLPPQAEIDEWIARTSKRELAATDVPALAA